MRDRRWRLSRWVLAAVLCAGGATAAPPRPAPPRPAPPRPLAVVTPAPPPVAPWPPPPRPAPVDPATAQAEWAAASALAPYPIAASLAFGRIAQNPMHPSHAAAVAQLGALSRELGGAARLDRFFTGVSDAVLQQARSGPVLLLAARNRYDQGDYDEAVRLASGIVVREPEGPEAQLLLAAAQVQRRQSVPAMQGLQRVVAALGEGPPSRDRAWLRDLALLSTGRVFGGAAVRLDENNLPVIDTSKLSAAVKFYESVEPASPLFADAAREMAWLFWLAGDHVHAAGLGRWLSSPAASSPYALDGDVLRAASAAAYCDAETARAATAQLRARASALQAHLSPLAAAGSRDDAWVALLAAAREGRMEPDAALQIARLTADRATARQLQYLARVDAETRAVPREAAALAEERARVVARLAQTVRDRVTDALATAAARLVDASRIEIAIADPRGAADVLVDRQEADMRGRLVWDRELDPWQARLPYVAPRYESQLWSGPSRFMCTR